MALTFAFVSFFAWGIGILFEAIAARKLESYSALFWGFLLSLAAASIYAPFVLPDLKNLTLFVALTNIFVAFFFIAGIVTYYEGLKKGNPTIVAAISSSFPAVIVVLSIVFLGEKINFYQLFSIAVIFVGLFLSSANLKELYRNKFFKDRGVVLAILTMISWGIALTFIKIPVEQIGWFWPTYFVFALTPIIFLFMRVSKKKLVWPSKQIWPPLIISAILVRVAEYAYNFAISKGLVAVVAPIAGANPVLFVPLAFFVFKEPITRQQLLGIALTLTGIVALSFFSV